MGRLQQRRGLEGLTGPGSCNFPTDSCNRSHAIDELRGVEQ